MVVNGIMTQQWTVWCGGVTSNGVSCSQWDQVSGTKKSAGNDFKLQGWKRYHGVWLCPKCGEKKEKRKIKNMTNDPMTFSEFETWLLTQGKLIGIPGAGNARTGQGLLYFRGTVKLPNGKLQLITYFPSIDKIERD